MGLILIVDDAAFSRRMIRKALQADGYDILEATNGREGLEIARTHNPDLILTDLLMPDMNGFELLKTLTELGLNIPTIIITADIQESSRQQGLELGAAGFINKPPSSAELSNTIQQFFNSQD